MSSDYPQEISLLKQMIDERFSDAWNKTSVHDLKIMFGHLNIDLTKKWEDFNDKEKNLIVTSCNERLDELTGDDNE